MFSNFCRDVLKILPWCLKTFAVAFTNFCRDVFKLLPWRLHTFAVAFKNFCRALPNHVLFDLKISLTTQNLNDLNKVNDDAFFLFVRY